MTEPLRRISLSPATDPHVRAATRLLEMVHELHKVGYQQLRISPGMSPSGMHWRCPITCADNMRSDGFSMKQFDELLVANYSSASGTAYFDWPGAARLSAREMANAFIDRFPMLAARGWGRDWPYAGWLCEVLGRAEAGGPGAFVSLYADYPIDREELEAWRPPRLA